MAAVVLAVVFAYALGSFPTGLLVAERDGLSQALHHWLQGARLALIIMAVLAIISGAGLGFAALGDGRTPVAAKTR